MHEPALNGIEYLRELVKWANSEPEDRWCPPNLQPLGVRQILAAYERYLRTREDQ